MCTCSVSESFLHVVTVTHATLYAVASDSARSCKTTEMYTVVTLDKNLQGDVFPFSSCDIKHCLAKEGIEFEDFHIVTKQQRCPERHGHNINYNRQGSVGNGLPLVASNLAFVATPSSVKFF